MGKRAPGPRDTEPQPGERMEAGLLREVAVEGAKIFVRSAHSDVLRADRTLLGQRLTFVKPV